MRDEADASRGSRSRATTKSSEDYLEAILVIRRLRGSCRNVDIAERMGVAEATLDKHRFFERLLVESGVDAETASAEACRMEHCLSEDSYRRFAAYLGSRRDEGDGG